MFLRLKKNNVKKVVNASSSSVYGNPNYTPVDEDHPLQPISIYGSDFTRDNSRLCGFAIMLFYGRNLRMLPLPIVQESTTYEIYYC